MLKHEHRALFGIRVLADDDLATLAADVRKLAAGAFALIEHGWPTTPPSRAFRTRGTADLSPTLQGRVSRVLQLLE